MEAEGRGFADEIRDATAADIPVLITVPEQRFMAYESIINGARGLTYFGGGLPQTLNERDKPLEFNWTYFDRVMRPLFDEIGPKSPILRPAAR